MYYECNMGFEPDNDFQKIILSSISQANETISYLREQYEESLKKQQQLEKQLLELQCHKCNVRTHVTNQVQCSSVYKKCNTECQTEKYSPDSDDRFFQKVDDIVRQNKELHENIYTLQKRLEELDSSRVTLDSDFTLKTAEAIEKLNILQTKKNISYQKRIQILESENDNAINADMNWESSLYHTSHLLDLDSDDRIAEHGVKMIKNLEKSLKIATPPKSLSTQEFNKIRLEKDSAVKKCVKLDLQLATIKKSKEAVEGQVIKLEEELQSLRLFYNLHQSLSQEASLRDQYNTQVSELTERLKQRETELLASQRENDGLAAMIKQLQKQLAQQHKKLQNGAPPHHFNPSSSSKGSDKRFSSSSSVFSLM